MISIMVTTCFVKHHNRFTFQNSTPLLKIHKLASVSRSIAGCEMAHCHHYVAKLLQPIAKQLKSYLKDSTDFINFIEKKDSAEGILVSMDLISLYTNIPLEQGIQTVCRSYETFYLNRLPIPTPLAVVMLSWRLFSRSQKVFDFLHFASSSFSSSNSTSSSLWLWILTSQSWNLLWSKLSMISLTVSLSLGSIFFLVSKYLLS